MIRKVNGVAKVFLAALVAAEARAGGYDGGVDGQDGPQPAVVVAPKVAPAESDLMEFSGGPLTQNRFFVAGHTVTVEADGEVRYVLVVKTQGGATNITYEGMSCDRRQYRTYYLGRPDGTWVKAKAEEWGVIEPKSLNQHRQTLYREVFCPLGPVSGPEEARRALLRNRPVTDPGGRP